MQVSMKSPNMASGRGARFLDLVQQNKLSPQATRKRRMSLCESFLKDRDEANSKPKAPVKKEYLEFSSQVKFNPHASPISSILSKRKAENDTPGSKPASSPLTSSTKRKRVGFKDPVSSTKEYIISDEEERQKSLFIRRLQYDNIEADEDELGEINKENITIKVESFDDFKEIQEPANTQPEDNHDHNYVDKKSPQSADISTSSVSSDTSMGNEAQLTFKNQSELMDYVTKNLSVDELLKKLTQAEEESLKRKELISKVIQSVGFGGIINEYFKINETPNAKLTLEQNALITNIITEVSKLMQTNPSVKHKVLDVLSENHSKALLDHALQENSPNAVCNKIALPNIVNFLIHKANVDESEENEELMQRLNSQLIRQLINNTHNFKAIVPEKKEVCELMELLFKNKPLSEIIDVSNVVLRKLVEKR